MRFQIDDAKLQGKGLTMLKIENRIKHALQDIDTQIIRDQGGNNPKPVLRIRMPNLADDDSSISAV